jgi:hypothetical protein
MISLRALRALRSNVVSFTGAPAERLRGLGDLPGAQTPRTHANAANAAVDHGAHQLEVGLEPSRADVVGVTVLAADHWTFPADLTLFGHMKKLSAFSV